MPDTSYSAGELAAAANAWCVEHQVVPMTGQASDEISMRNVRYYRAQGLLDAPVPGAGFTGKHLKQLISVRVLQATGLPLRKIQELLYGRDEADLDEILRRALAGRTDGLDLARNGDPARASGESVPAAAHSGTSQSNPLPHVAADLRSPRAADRPLPDRGAPPPSGDHPPGYDSWAAHVIGREYVLISRASSRLSPLKLKQIAAILAAED